MSKSYVFYPDQDLTPDMGSISMADLDGFADDVSSAMEAAMSAIDTASMQLRASGKGDGNYPNIRNIVQEAYKVHKKSWRRP